MKSTAKQHPTGLSLVAVTLLLAIAGRAGIELSEEEAIGLIVGVGAFVSFLSPRFKKRVGAATNDYSPVIGCITEKLRDESGPPVPSER